VQEGVYRRSIALDGQTGTIAVRSVPGRHHLELEVRFPDVGALARIVGRVRRMFDLDADPLTIDAQLERDPELRPLVRARPGLRVPGAWDGFELAVRAILGQQVSVRAARTVAARLVERFGERTSIDGADASLLFPGPQVLADADLRAVGLPATRAATIRRLAREVYDGAIDVDTPRDPAVVSDELRAIPGIGAWTAEYVAMRALGEPDAFPAADLGLLSGAGSVLGGDRAAWTAASLAQRSEDWRPWRAYAAMHLWVGAMVGCRS
jgi:AraC family transcriptional regulator of adaptative response / DNA-3-methyladenine glycosylase II